VQPPVEPEPVIENGELHCVTLRSEYAPLFDPPARRRIDEVRRSFRSDPRTLAYRPTVANLPMRSSQSVAQDGVMVALLVDAPASEAS
jgi:hypothetical protein